MLYHFNLNEAHVAPVLSMVLATFSFCCYWFLFVSDAFKKICYKKSPGDDGIIRHILLLKYAGLLVLGIIPVCLFIVVVPQYTLYSLGIAFNANTALQSVTWMLALGIPIILLMRFAVRRPNTFTRYPQIRVQYWDLWLMVRYSVAWGVYMLGYETMFRGLLLFPLANSLGVWPAIAINTTLYAASHLPKGSNETYAAMFFGPLLCIVTLQTETIWAAWLIHTILAVSHSMAALKFHPDFIIVRNRKPHCSQCDMGCDC